MLPRCHRRQQELDCDVQRPGVFVDSGSNGTFFLDAATLGIRTCSVSSSFYCSAAPMTDSAITTGTNGNSGTVAFSIANAPV
jgi:hypothetical protein